MPDAPEGPSPTSAADADPLTGFGIGTIQPAASGAPGAYEASSESGTSLATPLVAGIVADAQAGQAGGFGFINPLLYSLRSGAYYPTLPVTSSTPMLDRSGYSASGFEVSPLLSVFDDQNRSATNQVTAPGYDTMTGLGTPRGNAFIAALQAGG